MIRRNLLLALLATPVSKETLPKLLGLEYGVPEYGVPEYGVPEYGVPEHEAPTFEAPTFEALGSDIDIAMSLTPRGRGSISFKKD